MRELEEIDARDRLDGTLRMKRLRQIPGVTGKFLAFLAIGTPGGTMVEIGTSAGYSTLFLAMACRETGRKIITYEILEDKAELARETFRVAGVADIVELVVGDARDYLGRNEDISFCFLDAEKEIYRDCYDLVIGNMVSGGLLAADNVTSHREILEPFIEYAESDDRVDSLIVPIGKGILLCRMI